MNFAEEGIFFLSSDRVLKEFDDIYQSFSIQMCWNPEQIPRCLLHSLLSHHRVVSSVTFMPLAMIAFPGPLATNRSLDDEFRHIHASDSLGPQAIHEIVIFHAADTSLDHLQPGRKHSDALK